jgi:cytochrome c oxidase subunit IV
MELSKVNIKNANKKNILSWLWLIVLTVLSTYVSLFIDLLNVQKSLFIITVLFIVFLKGQQIIDVFMELKHAPKFWRGLLLAYVILLPMIIGLIYLL